MAEEGGGGLFLLVAGDGVLSTNRIYLRHRTSRNVPKTTTYQYLGTYVLSTFPLELEGVWEGEGVEVDVPHLWRWTCLPSFFLKREKVNRLQNTEKKAQNTEKVR